jgi:hypothetical protein
VNTKPNNRGWDARDNVSTGEQRDSDRNGELEADGCGALVADIASEYNGGKQLSQDSAELRTRRTGKQVRDQVNRINSQLLVETRVGHRRQTSLQTRNLQSSSGLDLLGGSDIRLERRQRVLVIFNQSSGTSQPGQSFRGSIQARLSSVELSTLTPRLKRQNTSTELVEQITLNQQRLNSVGQNGAESITGKRRNNTVVQPEGRTFSTARAGQQKLFVGLFDRQNTAALRTRHQASGPRFTELTRPGQHPRTWFARIKISRGHQRQLRA